MKYNTLENGVGELKFYGDISEWWISGEDFTRTIEEMDGKFQKIHIRAHCFGGSVFEGNVMYNALLRCKAEVWIYIDGVAASMFTIVMMAANKVIMASNAFIMIHNPSAGVWGNAREIFSTYNLLISMEKNFAKVYSKRSGKSEKTVMLWFDGYDHWFSAEEALAENLIHEIDDPVVQDVLATDKPTEDGQQELMYGRYAAALEGAPPASKIKKDQIENKNINMKKELIARFGLTGVTENSTDAEIQAALQSKIDAGAESGKAQVKAAIEAVISGVEKTAGSPFEANLRGQLVAVGETMGIEAMQMMLGLQSVPSAGTAPAAAAAPPVPAVPKVVNMLSNASASGVDAARASWTWNDWQKNDPKALAKMEDSDPAIFKALYKAEFDADLN